MIGTYFREDTRYEAMWWQPGTDVHKDLCDWLHGERCASISFWDAEVPYITWEQEGYGSDEMREGEWLLRYPDGLFLTDSDEHFQDYFVRWREPNSCPIGMDSHGWGSAQFCSAGVCATCAGHALTESVELEKENAHLRSVIVDLKREISHHICGNQ